MVSSMCSMLPHSFCGWRNRLRMHLCMCKPMFVAFVLVMIPFLPPLSEYYCSLFDVICAFSVCMGCVCQGQIVPISLIRASKNGCFCGDNTGSKRGTACFKHDTCNMLRYKSSVCVTIQTHCSAMFYVYSFR